MGHLLGSALGINTFGREGKESKKDGLGKEKSWASKQSQQRPQLSSYGILSSGGRPNPLYACWVWTVLEKG